MLDLGEPAAAPQVLQPRQAGRLLCEAHVTSVSRSTKYSRVKRFHSTTLPLLARAYLQGGGPGWRGERR